MPPIPELPLHEELLLLALRNREGTLHWRAGNYRFALGGGILAELLLASRIGLTPDRKQGVTVLDSRPFGDDLLDEALGRVAAARRPARVESWVYRFATLRRLRQRTGASLCVRGVLKETEETVLLVFRRKTYPECDPRVEQRIVERLRRAIFLDETNVPPRTVALVALAEATGLLAIAFSRKELRQRKARLRQLREAEVFAGSAAKGVRDAIAAATAACAAACAAASAAAASG
jgi:golgi phosphoprotein 3